MIRRGLFFFVLQDPGRNNSSPDGIRAAEIQREELRRLFVFERYIKVQRSHIIAVLNFCDIMRRGVYVIKRLLM